MLPAIAATFDGEGGSFPGYNTGVALWRKVANLEVCKRTSAFFFLMELAARDARMAPGSTKPPDPDGANLAATGLRDYFSPDAQDAVDPDIVRFSSFKR